MIGNMFYKHVILQGKKKCTLASLVLCSFGPYQPFIFLCFLKKLQTNGLIHQCPHWKQPKLVQMGLDAPQPTPPATQNHKNKKWKCDYERSLLKKTDNNTLHLIEVFTCLNSQTRWGRIYKFFFPLFFSQFVQLNFLFLPFFPRQVHWAWVIFLNRSWVSRQMKFNN